MITAHKGACLSDILPSFSVAQPTILLGYAKWYASPAEMHRKALSLEMKKTTVNKTVRHMLFMQLRQSLEEPF